MKPIAAACPTLLLMLGACSGWRPDGEANAPKPVATPASASTGADAPVSMAPEPTPPSPGPNPSAAAAADKQVSNNAAPEAKSVTPAPVSPSASETPGKSKQPSSRPPAPRPASPVQGSTAGTQQPVASPPAQRPATPPPLDITSLEQRLKDTHAIGIFTKLSLKNQVDDLLAQFRAHYRSNGSPPLGDLRQRYDLLMLKVLSLLQDGDPPLAQTIGSSREAIWGILSDPNKLAAISS
jgi:hypothetical protein